MKNNIKTNYLALMLLFITSISYSQRRLDLSQWQMVWNDEFNYPGNDVNLLFDGPNAKWTYYEEDGVPYEAMTTEANGDIIAKHIKTKNNMYLQDGMLYLGAKREHQNPSTLDYPFLITHNGKTVKSEAEISWVRSRYDKDFFCGLSFFNTNTNMWTNDVYRGFQYGAFEIRAKIPRKSGDYSAFWFWQSYWATHVCAAQPHGNLYCDVTLPAPNYCVDGPGGCPGWEVDVFETYQSPEALIQQFLGDSLMFFATIQDNVFNSPTCKECATFYKWNNSSPKDEFHTYTLVWTPTSIVFFIDGNEIRTSSLGIPPAKLMAYLTNWKGNGDYGTAAPFVVDYFRVYRPNIPNGNYNLSPNTPNGQYLWTGWDDPKMTAYLNTITNATYTTQNFQKTILSQTSISSPKEGALLEEGTNHRLYYHSGNGQLKTNTNGTEILLSSNVATNAKISIEYYGNSSHNIYYQGTDNDIWVHFRGTCGMCGQTLKLDPQNLYANDVSSEVQFAPPINGLPPRVYYRNSTYYLCYFEYCASLNKWFRHQTNIYGIRKMELRKNGELWFIGTDMKPYKVNTLVSSNALCNNLSVVWAATSYTNYFIESGSFFATLCDPSILRFHPTIDRIYGQIELVRQDGASPMIRTGIQRLCYWTRNGSTYNFSIVPEIIDLVKLLDIRISPQGKTEVYYISRTGKLKTWYERPIPPLNGQSLYLQSTLDIFSQMQVNPIIDLFSTPIFRNDTTSIPLHDIDFAAITSTEPLTIYTVLKANNTASANGSYGKYVRTSMGVVLPPNRSGMCDWVFSNIRWDHYNGLEFKNTNSNVGSGKTPTVEIIPNPANSRATISISESEAHSISVYNLMGQFITTVLPDRGTFILNTQDWDEGIYLLVVQSQMGLLKTEKLIIQH
jgi:beta-glucanase (GH16 family)